MNTQQIVDTLTSCRIEFETKVDGLIDEQVHIKTSDEDMDREAAEWDIQDIQSQIDHFNSLIEDINTSLIELAVLIKSAITAV